VKPSKIKGFTDFYFPQKSRTTLVQPRKFYRFLTITFGIIIVSKRWLNS
jgi:hypothetical protein